MCIIHQSSDGIRCDCTGTGHVGATCGIYFPYGPQTNVNEEKVTSEGWTECHSESMTVRQNSANLDAIMRKCSKSQLMMGCRKVGSSTITLLAAAPNGKEALKVTGDNGQIIYGSKWYRREGSKSYGFVHESSELNFPGQQAPDSSDVKGELRLSYYLTGNHGGYRCGSTEGMDFWHESYGYGHGWQRLYYHAEIQVRLSSLQT